MKETTNINIGGQAFVADNDAYQMLRKYLTDVRSRITGDTEEIMADIEQGLAAILQEMLPSPLMVITLSMTEHAIQRMGKPEEFGPRCDDFATEPTDNVKKLYRDRENRVLAGICGGIGKYMDTDPSVIRLVTLILIIFGGLSLWVYIIFWLIIPQEPRKFNISK